MVEHAVAVAAAMVVVAVMLAMVFATGLGRGVVAAWAASVMMSHGSRYRS
jgi:ABC-type proline/glycine betaine transport system permease subunit